MKIEKALLTEAESAREGIEALAAYEFRAPTQVELGALIAKALKAYREERGTE